MIVYDNCSTPPLFWYPCSEEFGLEHMLLSYFLLALNLVEVFEGTNACDFLCQFRHSKISPKSSVFAAWVRSMARRI